MTTDNDTREMIKGAVRDAFKEELAVFYIDREAHYKQHQWLGEMIKYTDACKSIVLKAVLTIIVGGALSLMIIGFSFRWRG